MSVFIWDGASVGPADAVVHFGGIAAVGIGEEPIDGVALPPSFGDEALSVAHLVLIGTAESVTVRIAWRYEGWTVVLSAAVIDAPDAVRALALRLAERQCARLALAFPRIQPGKDPSSRIIPS